MEAEPPKPPSNNFELLLSRYIGKLDEVIEKLTDLQKTIASHHQACNIAKAAGTAVSSTGVAVVIGSVLSAPVAGAGTLAVGAGGAVMSLTGGLSNIITDYVDYRTTTLILQDLESIVKSKEDFDQSLMRQLKHFGMMIDKLMESGVDKDSAIIVTVKGIANGCIDLTEEPNMKVMNTLSTIVKLQHIESAALEALPIIGKTMHLSEKSFQFIYNFFGLSAQTGQAVFKTIGRISSVVSLAFTIIDIALLVKDWSKEHPTAEFVLETTRKVEEEKMILSDLLEVIESSKDQAEDIWDQVRKDIEEIEIEEFAFEKGFVFVDKSEVEMEA